MGFIKLSKGGLYAPSTTLVRLYNILSEMDGVMDWAVNQDGDVTVEYDHNRINPKIVEQALVGIGLQHVVYLEATR